MAQLKSYDTIAYLAELLSARAPKEWADCVKVAEAIEKDMVAATQQAIVPVPEKPKKVVGGKGK